MNAQMQQLRPSATVLDVIVVGGGLSGIFVANGLLQHKLEWKLLEASDRLGGRLVNAPSTKIDMGGAWIWPDHQPHIRELVSRLSLSTFTQPDDDSSTRIEGGAVQFIDKLSQQICERDATENDKKIQLNSPVQSCKLLKDPSADGHALVQVETADGALYVARKVVLAVPPKLLSDHVSFDPPLSGPKREAMAASRTWMAGVTKVALVYPKRFWDLQSSNTGFPSTDPAFQVYDSGTIDGEVAALTFFSHVSPDSPAQSNDELLAKQVAGQMATLWGYLDQPHYAKLAHSYSSFHCYRWPAKLYISGDDSRPSRIHPHPMPSRALSTPEWDNALLFAGTETDLVSPGVMDGAIGAAKRVLKSLID
jgi:monoamine oxidase